MLCRCPAHPERGARRPIRVCVQVVGQKAFRRDAADAGAHHLDVAEHQCAATECVHAGVDGGHVDDHRRCVLGIGAGMDHPLDDGAWPGIEVREVDPGLEDPVALRLDRMDHASTSSIASRGRPRRTRATGAALVDDVGPTGRRNNAPLGTRGQAGTTRGAVGVHGHRHGRYPRGVTTRPSTTRWSTLRRGRTSSCRRRSGRDRRAW